ncbi:MAG: DegT/DnrJ/EryC1/StrS family aminotransferase [Xanthomonadaceae bacterium]|nr:DegT/DnrJ/EryC1/StrS family aminotransferase [Xanthomonadaceae bacterium]
MPRRRWRELPPTAGLPLRWRDLLPGPAPALDRQLAPMLGVDRLQLTCSGTAALVIALRTLSAASHRREVIVPAYTCPLVALAVAHCGLTLKVCDLLPGSLQPDPAMLADLCNTGTLAIVPAHLAGRVVDIAPVCAIAAGYGAFVIEDAAQALGARHADGTVVGALGDIGFYSLAAGKGLTLYEGGLLLSRHPRLQAALHETAAAIAPYRLFRELRRCIELAGYAALYGPHGLRWAYGAPLRRALRHNDPIGAAGDRFPRHIPLHRVGHWRQRVGAHACLRWPDYIESTRRSGMQLRSRLHTIPGIDIVADAPGAQGVWPALLLLLPSADAATRALNALWGEGLGVGRPFVHVLPDYDYLQDLVAPAQVPNARDFAARAVSIGNSPWMRECDLQRIMDTLAAACR